MRETFPPEAMPKGALHEALSAGAMQDMNTFRRSVKEEWFATALVFVASVCMASITLPPKIPNTLTIRAILILMHYGLVKGLRRCPSCRRQPILTCRKDGSWKWTCPAMGNNHLQHTLNSHGFLKVIRVGNWIAWLQFITFLRSGERWATILVEMGKAYGVTSHKDLEKWRRDYQVFNVVIVGCSICLSGSGDVGISGLCDTNFYLLIFNICIHIIKVNRK